MKKKYKYTKKKTLIRIQEHRIKEKRKEVSQVVQSMGYEVGLTTSAGRYLLRS